MVTVLLVGVAGVPVAVGAAPSPGTYTIADIGSLSGTTGSSQASAINANGDVVGQSTSLLGVSHAVLYKDGLLVDLGALGNDVSAGDGLNASDTGVGYDIPAGSLHAVEFSDEVVNDLTSPSAVAAQATSINDNGVIVGGESLAAGQETAVEFGGGGTISNLGDLPGGQPTALASDVNDGGDIVGFAMDKSGVIQAVTFAGGVATALPALPGSIANVARKISATGGFVVGYSLDGSGNSHAMQFAPGTTATDLGRLPSGLSAEALAVNSSDVAVGYSENAAGVSTAVMFDGGTVIDLNSLLPAGTGWTLQVANGVNDSGVISGYGIDNGVQRGFVLSPPTAPIVAPPAKQCPPLAIALDAIPLIGPSLGALVCQIEITLGLNL
jgi:probable HAF family extracellular repeat protein